MTIFKKIRDKLDRRKSLNKAIHELKELDEVLLEQRIEIFKEIVTPKFEEIGLTNWDGKHLWFSDFNKDGIKHVIQYNVFKYYEGSFSYGNCYDFIPTVSREKLVNHKTNKSTKIIYYKRLDGLQKQMETNDRKNPDKISTINETRFKDDLNSVLTRNIPKIEKWFKERETIDENISSLLIETKNPPFDITPRSLSFEYILGFLYKKNKNTDSSNYWVNEHFEKLEINEVEKNLVIERMEKV